MILYSSAVNCGVLWVTFGLLLAYESDFGATLGSLRHHFWHAKATLASLWKHFSHMMVTSWQLWDDSVVLIGISARLCRHFGVPLGALAVYGGAFGVTLRLFWSQFGISLGICG